MARAGHMPCRPLIVFADVEDPCRAGADECGNLGWRHFDNTCLYGGNEGKESWGMVHSEAGVSGAAVYL